MRPRRRPLKTPSASFQSALLLLLPLLSVAALDGAPDDASLELRRPTQNVGERGYARA